MIVLTGVSGFIGSCMLAQLNANGYSREVVVVDDFYKIYKDCNTDGKVVREWMHRDIFLEWLESSKQKIDAIIHLGARTDTTSTDQNIFHELNLYYSKRLWKIATERDIIFLYASSAATYGDGSLGFDDDHDLIPKLIPLNLYGDSKNDFDKWVLEQTSFPSHWAGFKFFNVYGPNEYHKNRMASVIYHTYQNIKSYGKMQLFKSHKNGIADGHQKRDFIYVKDVIKVLHYFLESTPPNGIYNLGTGKARTFLDLACLTFKSMDLEPNIDFVDTPEDIREKYQYFTEANINKLRSSGYTHDFVSLEDGIEEYVKIYLSKSAYF